MALAYDLPKNQFSEILGEIETHTGIVVAAGFDRFEFALLSVQEYLCANYISRSPFPGARVPDTPRRTATSDCVSPPTKCSQAARAASSVSSCALDVGAALTNHSSPFKSLVCNFFHFWNYFQIYSHVNKKTLCDANAITRKEQVFCELARLPATPSTAFESPVRRKAPAPAEQRS